MAERLRAAGHTLQSYRFLFLYALAVAGGAVAYMPLITVLLPVRVTALAGSADISWLAYITLGGALTASVTNILFGWLSDRTANRRGWILAGLACSTLGLVSFPLAQDLVSLVALIVLWQCGLNMMLAPLSAWAGDCVPDNQKGMLGGLLAFAPAIGALSGVLVTYPGLALADNRLWIVAGMVAAMILPATLFGRSQPMPHLMEAAEPLPEPEAQPDTQPTPTIHKGVQAMWWARLLIQIAEAALFAYLLFWLRSIDPAMDDSFTARTFGIVLCLAVPLALLVGRWSDRVQRPIIPLAICAGLASLGLLMMSLVDSRIGATISFAFFSLPAAIFLSLHTAQTLRVLKEPRNRGRDLGVFNLTNTMPSLVMPWLTLALVPMFGFSGLFLLLAGLAGIAALILVSLSRRYAH